MGGDQLVPALVGERIEPEKGEAIRNSRDEIFEQLIDEVAPLEGARELIEDLKERGFATVLASSSPEKEIDHYLDLLDARELVDAWTTNDDVEATKPEPDVVRAAFDKAATHDAVMVGDTPWDVEAARAKPESRRRPSSPEAFPSRSCAKPARPPSTNRSPSCDAI